LRGKPPEKARKVALGGGMADKSFVRLHMLWSYAVTGGDMDSPLPLELRLIGTKNSDELLITMVFHITTDDDDGV
jgi:hypothetical protein